MAINPQRPFGVDEAPDDELPHVLERDLLLKRLAMKSCHADPANPAECTAEVVELAHISELELLNDGAELHATRIVTDDDRAAGLVGHSVTYEAPDHAKVSGTVDQVCLTAQGPVLTVDGVDGVTPSSLVEVR